MYRAAVLISVLLLAMPAVAQVDCNQGMEPIDNDAPSRMSPLDFTHVVSAKEAALAKAFANYGYTVEINVETLKDGKVDGTFSQTSIVAFDDSGTRIVKPVKPASDTLTRLHLSGKDINMLITAPPFALTTDVLAEKDAVYSGRQRLGEHNTSVFDLLPRNDQAPLRGFIGRVWVWAGKGAVLRSCGRAAAYPIGQIRYEIRRGQVDENNWFPVLIRADEDVRAGGDTVHVRVNVKYSDYKAR
jgi:hypothetical protein